MALVTPSRFPGFGDTDNRPHSDSTTNRHDDSRIVRERARYIEATTDLSDSEAQTLAWSEAGYSHSGIAKKVRSTEATVAERLDRIAARYGIEAVLAKQPDERGQTPLSPATPDEIAAFPRPTRAEWRELAEQYPERAPEWFDDPERDPTHEGRRGEQEQDADGGSRHGEQGGAGQ